MDPLENRLSNPYARRLHDEYNRQYSLASLARSKGLDSSTKVESQTTYDLAERVEKAVGPAGIAERIRELVKIISREETALKVSEEIVLAVSEALTKSRLPSKRFALLSQFWMRPSPSPQYREFTMSESAGTRIALDI